MKSIKHALFSFSLGFSYAVMVLITWLPTSIFSYIWIENDHIYTITGIIIIIIIFIKLMQYLAACNAYVNM